MNYYNDNNPECVAWLNQLIAEKLIPYGYVDGRSIAEVTASDLQGFTQCHFFAGIGGWALALRLAGLPDTERIDTASLPCQPFSVAGLGLGESDSRHLWPCFSKLLRERRPARIVGEQVASKDGRNWLARIRVEMEEMGYAVGAGDLCAASVGAPHIRQRLFWGGVDAALFADNRLAHTLGQQTDSANKGRLHAEPGSDRGVGGLEHSQSDGRQQRGTKSGGRGAASGCSDGRLGHSDDSGKSQVGRVSEGPGVECSGSSNGGLGHTNIEGSQRWVLRRDSSCERSAGEAGLGYWSNFDLVYCRDGKTRRIESGAQCLVNGLSPDMDARWNTILEEIQKEVNLYASAQKKSPIQTVFEVWQILRPFFLRWRAGGHDDFCPQAVLFAAMCELARKLGHVFDRSASGFPEVLQESLRDVRNEAEFASSPQGREHSQQCSEQFANLMRELSQKVAPIQGEIAGKILHGFPLATGFDNRVKLLRGYGNAIVPQVAAKFLEAFFEVTR